ncbi:MAG: sulfurtransferase [Dehalococcoidia bacterium]|jgi:thiosulfate/3-mercaptopyruvate sulfurtransferase|nr:sulfurtransferase [Dehalococcoidia bacterium]
MTTTLPGQLVETEWLAEHLGDADLRVLECTTILRPGDDGRLRAESGRPTYEAGHIPGSGFADLPGDLSDRESELRFMMPPAEQFAETMSSYGVGEGTRVVLYDRAGGMWAARIWWMLRAFGFDEAAVLNGGWSKWVAEGQTTSDAASAYPRGNFVARPREGLIADREEVLTAIEDGATCIVNALTEEQHRGEGAARYGRAGRITGSVNVPANSLVDPETKAYHPLEELRSRFASVGADTAERVIAYCGGGIAASSDAFVLTLLGYENVAIYDASLSEWAADESLPMEVG